GLAHGVADIDLAGVGGALHGETDHRPAVERRALGGGGAAVGHGGQRGPAHAAAIGHGGGEVGQVAGLGDGAERAHGLFAAAHGGAAAGLLELDARELLADQRRAGAEALHGLGPQGDADLAVHATDAPHRAHAGHGEQALGDGVVDEPAE